MLSPVFVPFIVPANQTKKNVNVLHQPKHLEIQSPHSQINIDGMESPVLNPFKHLLH